MTMPETNLPASKPEFDQRWIAKYTAIKGPQPWYEKLPGVDREKAKAWILANPQLMTKG